MIIYYKYARCDCNELIDVLRFRIYQKFVFRCCSILFILLFIAYAFAELIDNALTATAENESPRNIEIRLVNYCSFISLFTVLYSCSNIIFQYLLCIRDVFLAFR